MVACADSKKENNHDTPAVTHKFDSIGANSKKTVDSIAKAKMEDTTRLSKTERLSISSLDTTLKAAGYEFTFSEVSKPAFEQNFRYSNPTSQKYHQLCVSIPVKKYPAVDCADTLEASQLKKHKAFIQVFPVVSEMVEGRKKMGKRFAFGTRKQFRLVDNMTYGEASNFHYFREIIQLNDHPYFVFFRQNWEGADYLMVSGKTGKDTHLNGVPQISPNKLYAFTTPYDAGTYHNFLGVELWQATATQLTKVFSLNIDVGSPWRSYWLDDQTIMVEIRKGSLDNYTYRYGKISLRKLPKSK
ncbi:hypothetical protein M23134_00078 [Microscilla marina ATCC 23134]|uniref:Uncharacterized protein n=2 Tax=Microscilla marina TaxID=1027 RepID=A1ZKV8_MICM2|nr:hypothetical protein M23134_00078 [Microscilla marina ATCC 23134]